MRRIASSALAPLLLAAASCVAVPRAAIAVEPFAGPPDRAQLSEEEQRSWSAGDDFDRSIRRARNLYRSEALSAYLQGVLDRVFPDFRGAITLRGVVRDPDLNAFVLPNGSVYLTLGLVGRLQSEAQLAVVLGHEAAHFVHRHAFQQSSSAKTMSAFGLGLGVLTGGWGAIGNVLLAGAFYGYSRDNEREADAVGFDRVLKAGYPPQAGVEAFEILAADALLYDRKQPTFFASHPSMVERVQTFRELSAQRGTEAGGSEARPAADDPAGAARYREATRAARIDYVRLAVETGRQKSVVAMLEPVVRSGGASAEAAFWLGEAYRLRGEEGDLDHAVQAYRTAIETPPGVAAAWRGLGEIARRRGEREQAADAFRRYLDASPEATDRDAVRAELGRLGARNDEGEKK